MLVREIKVNDGKTTLGQDNIKSQFSESGDKLVKKIKVNNEMKIKVNNGFKYNKEW